MVFKVSHILRNPASELAHEILDQKYLPFTDLYVHSFDWFRNEPKFVVSGHHGQHNTHSSAMNMKLGSVIWPNSFLISDIHCAMNTKISVT
jgi:hypothetical protein